MDTTARAVVRMKKDKSLDKQAVNAALKSVKCSVASLEKTKVPLTVEAVETTVEGLG